MLVMGSQPSWPEARRTWYQPPWRRMTVTAVALGTAATTLASEFGLELRLPATTVWAVDTAAAWTAPSTSKIAQSPGQRLMPSPSARTAPPVVPGPSLYKYPAP